MLLLHGFPELALSWRDVLPLLARAGFRAVAPDLRGYGGTDKPEGGYDLDTLAADAAALIERLGGRAHVVGHDWGGAIAYHLAATRPALVDRLAVVNCPHPAVMAERVWRPRQLARSWYMLFFQVPGLPERLLSRNGGALVIRAIKSASIDRSRLTDERLAPYAANFAAPGTARAALAYYREALRGLARGPLRRTFADYPKIRAPFRLVWAEEDVALGTELTVDLGPWFEGPVDVRYLPGVGHFAPLEAPELVGASLVEHLVGAERGATAH